MTMAVERDAYRILGVTRGADDATIAEAYRALARRFHPDVAGDAATRQMMLINAAFDAIGTAERRQLYAEDEGPWPAAGAGQTRTPAADVIDRDHLRWTPPRDGTGAAGPPPGRPSGSVLPFGRHIGWSLGEIARVDPGYLVWLSDKREGRPYLAEIDALLQRAGYRSDGNGPDTGRDAPGGAFGRR
ncbi:MAG TPA: DnaJ domain-containing protein [Candidatus Limnocylindrales bacterium]|jgi:curved DNA-binding protein CbpA|nr:DnaJ domain-containing protein [Candidatus Limnocylindrales bacterium]